MDSFVVVFAIVSVSGFLLTVLAESILIPVLRSHKLGQKILDVGPRWHQKKNGTPIMGGLGFILATLIVVSVYFAIFASEQFPGEWIPLAMTLAFAVGNGAIGFVDDYCKLIKKQNEGLTWRQKLLLQLTLASAYVIVMVYTGNASTSLHLPFSGKSISLSWWFYPICVILLCGVVNGANLTDGVDGLATSVTFVISAFYAVYAFAVRNDSLSLLSALLLGGTLGFFLFNFHPARVFMGDTGSLFLGGMVIGIAFQLGELLPGLILCGVYILEMLSSLLQVVYFRVTKGKRLFRMAPIHHHFEALGWSENRIVAVFSAVEILFCIITWFAICEKIL